MNNSWISLNTLETKLYQANLLALNGLYPEQFSWFQKPLDEPLAIQANETWLTCRHAQHPDYWIFGGINPHEEMKEIERKGRDLPQNADLIIFAGCSIGYCLKPLIERILANENLRVIVAEPSMSRLKGMFITTYLDDLLKTGRFYFAATPINPPSLFQLIERFQLWNSEKVAIFHAPETWNRIPEEAFIQRFMQLKEKYRQVKLHWIGQFKETKRQKTSQTLQRALLVDFWPGMPQSVHLSAVQKALVKRGVATKTLPLHFPRVEAHAKEYAREMQKASLAAISTFQPDCIFSYAFHAPQFIERDYFDAIGVPWIQAVSNIAYFDTEYYPGEATAVIEKKLIPMYEKRGAKKIIFVPIMADYVAERLQPTSREHPIVFVGNSMGLPESHAGAFRERFASRAELLRYVEAAEAELSDFDQGGNVYDHLAENPPPQVDSLQDEYAIFRYLLCQSTSKRRQRLLEKLAEFDLSLFGFWETKLPPDSPLRSRLRGEMPIHQEPTIFPKGGIFLNIHSTTHVTGPNMRYFNIAGMGGFQLTDGDFGAYLEPDRESVYFKTGKEMVEKVRYYLDHPDEMDDIRASGYERVKRDWTYDRWVELALEGIGLKLSK